MSMSKRLFPPESNSLQVPVEDWRNNANTNQVYGTRRQLQLPEVDDTLFDGGVGSMSAEDIRRERRLEAQRRELERARITGGIKNKQARGEEAERLFSLIEKDNASLDFIPG